VALALDMIDELRGRGLTPPVVCADAGYGEITALRQGLEDRGIDYIAQVKATTSAYRADVTAERPAWNGRGRPPIARYHAANTPSDSVTASALSCTPGTGWLLALPSTTTRITAQPIGRSDCRCRWRRSSARA
jgi:DDE superfamily endonuclease